MQIREKEESYIESFEVLGDASSQCDYLISLGLELPPNEHIRLPENRLAGCKTAIWICARIENGRVYFDADSNSLLVKGMLLIMKDLYEGREKHEAAEAPPRFFDAVSDDVIYPEIKQNGLKRCYEKLLEA